MVHKFKEFLFRWGLYKRCPWCGSELWEVGYPKDFCWQPMKCSSDFCGFGKENEEPLHKYFVTDKNKNFWTIYSSENIEEFKKTLLPGCKVKEVNKDGERKRKK